MGYIERQSAFVHHLREPHAMDFGIIAAIGLLLVWAVGTFKYEAPGWIHLLLTLGVSLLVWRIVATQDKQAKK